LSCSLARTVTLTTRLRRNEIGQIGVPGAKSPYWLRIKSPELWFKANVPELAALGAWQLTSPANEKVELDAIIGCNNAIGEVPHATYMMKRALQNPPWVLRNNITNRQIEVVLGCRNNGGIVRKAATKARRHRPETTQKMTEDFMKPWLEAIEWKREAALNGI
jgi:hypothetical protein